MPILKKKNITGSSFFALECLVVFLLLLSTLAALMGVVNTHLTGSGVSFGGSGASLALIAFAINIVLFTKLIGLLCGEWERK